MKQKITALVIRTLHYSHCEFKLHDVLFQTFYIYTFTCILWDGEERKLKKQILAHAF
jgi:hypothetical protein